MYLATTAIDEFWPENKKNIIFAGEWCREYKKKYLAEIECLPFLWDDVKDVDKAQEYCKKIYEKTLQSLTYSVNMHLGINKDKEYYRRLLGNWLLQFIHQAYDKFSILKAAQKKGKIHTWTLNNEQFYYPFDVDDYNLKSNDDIYQLQLFSEVIRYMGVSNRTRKISVPLGLKEDLTFEKNPKDFKAIVMKVYLLLAKLIKTKEQAVIVGPYIKRRKWLLSLILICKSPRRIILDPFKYYLNVKNKPIDFNFRKKNRIKSTAFSSWIAQFAINNIPQCYLEYHFEFANLVKELYPSKGNCFFTYNALYGNIPFQYFVASRYKNDFIVSAQHGCSYGMLKRDPLEDYDRSIVDCFYTYGWTESAQTRPLPMPKLIKERTNVKTYGDILFVTTTRFRYITRFQPATNSTKNISDHVNAPIQFFSKLENTASLIIRHHKIDYLRKWNNRERIKEVFPEIREDKNKSFYRSLEQCRIFISDHMGTAFLEAMQANVPTIVFINKTSWLFRKKFETFIKDLEREKILFFCPHAAAYHLNYVDRDIGSWWRNKNLQKARKNFISKYALTSDNWMDRWKSELLGAINKISKSYLQKKF